MILTSNVTNELKPGDLVLYKDFTEEPWKIGIYHSYNTERCMRGQKYNIIVGVDFDDFRDDKTTDELKIAYPYRYVRKLVIEKD